MKNHHRSVKVLRRGDLAKLTGCNLETIRYYENIGVMPEPPRTSKNYRAYDESHVVDGGVQTCGEVQGLANSHLASVRAKIDDLRRIERVLSSTVAQCTGDDVPECPVIDALTEVT